MESRLGTRLNRIPGESDYLEGATSSTTGEPDMAGKVWKFGSEHAFSPGHGQPWVEQKETSALRPWRWCLPVEVVASEHDTKYGEGTPPPQAWPLVPQSSVLAKKILSCPTTATLKLFSAAAGTRLVATDLGDITTNRQFHLELWCFTPGRRE